MLIKSMAVILLLSQTAFGDLKEDCTFFYTKTGAMDIYRQLMPSGSCSLSAHPEAAGMVYRSYGISTDGSFMIFNSYGSSNNSSATGARVFYLFPRTQLPTLENSGENPVMIGLNPNVAFEFDRKSTKLLAFKGGSITEDVNVNPKNKGGVEILSYNGLLIDIGFTIGKDPAGNPNSESVARDHENNECKILNKELFNYSRAEFVFKFLTDESLKAFLSRRCPQLKLNF